jgi:hypothetical protein
LKIGVTNVITAPYRFGNHIAEQGIGAYDLAKETGSSNTEALTLAVGTGITRGTGALDVIESVKGQQIVGDSSSGISTQDFGSTTERVFHGTKGALQLATTAVVATKALGVGGNSAQVTRYMTEGEVAEVEKIGGNIPNYGPDGKFRPTHVTTEKPLDSASAAAKRYEIEPTPTHRATVPASRVKNLEMAPDGKPTTSGGGSQNATSELIPVKPREIKRLKP